MPPEPAPNRPPASTADHWNGVYASKPADGVSWFRPHLDRSLAIIDSLGLAPDAPILDVGAGASTLVDDLLGRGFRAVTLLDISERGLDVTRARLGDRASLVRWIGSDILHAPLPKAAFQLWHDRAALHFLGGAAERAAYAASARASVAPGGYALISGFAVDGPPTCSNLPVLRADAAEIASLLAPSFRLLRSESERHRTPWGSDQSFFYALCRRPI